MKKKLIRVTTVPLSLEKLLEGQLSFMNSFYETIAVSSDKERLEKYGKSEGVRTEHLELTRKITPSKDLNSLYKLYKFFKQEQPLIVHTHTPKAGIVGMLAAYLANVPIRLHTVAGLPLMEATGIKRTVLNIVEKLTYKCATNIYPNSKGLLEYISSEGFTKSKKLKIIGQGSSNGIDTTFFDPALFNDEDNNKMREKLGISEDDFIFIFVGRIVKDKGINELVSAFSKLSKKHKTLQLILVGLLEDDLDPLLPETMSIVSSNKYIHSCGYQVDVRPYFAISDALVFPSYREGFPNVVMQAGAMGLSSIVTDINGCNEIISEEKNGLIIPVKNCEALSNSMSKIIDDDVLQKNMSTNARLEITSKYERKQIYEALLAEYRELEAKL